MLRTLCACVLLGGASAALDPIVVAGDKLYNSVTKERFYIKGMTYGYEIDDANEDNWKVAVANMAEAGINAVRVYRNNPNMKTEPTFTPPGDASYDKFMAALESHGMYAIVSVTPTGGDPWGMCHLMRLCSPVEGQGCVDNNGVVVPNTQNFTCYPSCLLTYGQAVVSKFSKYTNTLAFVIGNEVMNSGWAWPAAACVRSYNRDLKNFMRSCKHSQRYIPTMYAAADDGWNANNADKTRMQADVNDQYKGHYLTCGEDESLRVDIMGYNIYRWSTSECTYETCAYNRLHDHVKSLGVPVVLTEFGCNVFYWDPSNPDPKVKKIGQRDWKQVPTIYGAKMSDVFSGGFAYSYGETGGKCDPSGDKPCFAFYSGGDPSGEGPPGNTKVCGYGGVAANGTVCNVDSFKEQMATVKLCDQPNPTVECEQPVGASICNWTSKDYSWTPPQCSSVTEPLMDTYNVTMYDPPTSRQDAPGYTKVGCAVHTLTKVEEAIADCMVIPTSYPTFAPTNKATTPSPTKPGAPTPPPGPSPPGPPSGPTKAPKKKAASGSHTGVIVGATIGSVAALGIVVAGATMHMRKKRRLESYPYGTETAPTLSGAGTGTDYREF